MYPYMILSDETEITHSHLIRETNTVEVHFERPTSNGFDTARCELPSYNWLIKNGYSDEEILDFDEFLKDNAHLLFRYAKSGGLSFA